jgi:hypothetical protein
VAIPLRENVPILFLNLDSFSAQKPGWKPAANDALEALDESTSSY